MSQHCKRWLKSIAIILFICALSACASNQDKDKTGETSFIPAFSQDQSSPEQKINSIRLAALKDAATSLGAQAGLAWRSQQINQVLQADSSELDAIFDFRQLMLDDDVLPPVLTQGDDAINQPDPDSLRLADKVFAIVSPPRFVTAPPNWRNYLMMNYTKPEEPNATLLPKGDAERAVWNAYIDKGWHAGVKQADQIFDVNLNRLKRDYKGMVLYRVLLAQHMVTAPFVAKTNLGVTGNANKMRIGDQVLRIAASSKLVTNPMKWKPVITQQLKQETNAASGYELPLGK